MAFNNCTDGFSLKRNHEMGLPMNESRNLKLISLNLGTWYIIY